MAIRLVDKYPNRVTAASSDYPHGKFRNRSSAGAKDGTPVDQAWGNDYQAFIQGMIEAAGITPNGNVDTVPNSQLLDALLHVTHGVTNVDVGGSANVTLNNAQQRVAGIRLTGTLTADIDIVVPDTQRFYVVINDTSGDFDATVTTSGGSGVIPPQGSFAWLRCDGSNVVSLTGPAPAQVPTNADLRDGVERTLYGAGGSLKRRFAVDFNSSGNSSSVDNQKILLLGRTNITDDPSSIAGFALFSTRYSVESSAQSFVSFTFGRGSATDAEAIASMSAEKSGIGGNNALAAPKLVKVDYNGDTWIGIHFPGDRLFRNVLVDVSVHGPFELDFLDFSDVSYIQDYSSNSVHSGRSGDIVESGSTPDGEYTRWENGDKLVGNEFDMGPANEFGSGTLSDIYRSSTINPDFPIAFDSAPFAAPYAFTPNVTSGDRYTMAGFSDIEATGIHNFQVYRGTDVSDNTRAGYVAWGK